MLSRHFAIAVATKLVGVPYVDFGQYTRGITGDGGADLTVGISAQSATDLAMLPPSGPLTATGERRFGRKV